MATAILDKLLQTQFGKHLIFWFFLVLCASNVAQWVDRKRQDLALEKCNAGRIDDQIKYSARISRCDSLRVEDYKHFSNEYAAEKERRIKWTKK